MSGALALAAPLVAGSSIRWRIVGWIVLTTALALLAIVITVRSVFIGQIALNANAAIAQEIAEFRSFAREGVDPQTAQPFASFNELFARYLHRQTPDRGETFIAVAPDGRVLRIDNGTAGGGIELADDPVRLAALLQAPQLSGVADSPQGRLRWGKTLLRTADGRQATFIVLQFAAPHTEAVARETLVLFAVAAAGLLLTAGMAWLVSGQILAPLRRMGAVAARVGQSSRGLRVPVQGDDELAALARTFNHMLDRVDRSWAAQQHFIDQVQRHLNAGRADAMARLQRLAQPTLPAAERERESAALQGQMLRLGQTLADLNLLMQRDRPDFLCRAPVALAAFSARWHGRTRQQHPAHRWALEAVADGSVALDAARVGDALRQLTDNAAHHTAEGAAIALGSELAEEAADDGPAVPVLRLWVRNPGVPLSADAARAMFARPDMPEAGHGQDVPCMGVGLAVVRTVAEAHGGYAWVESLASGDTRLGITLPALASADAGPEFEDTEVPA